MPTPGPPVPLLITSQYSSCHCCVQYCIRFPIFQAAEKEAALAQQEEEKAEYRKKTRAEKKALKKKKKTRGTDKRKADEDDEKEWGDDEEGKALQQFYLGHPSLPETLQKLSRELFS